MKKNIAESPIFNNSEKYEYVNLPPKKLRQLFYNVQRFVGLRPTSLCLITGCPRSGTTAVRDWLRKQKGIASTNESRILISASNFLKDVRRFHDLSAQKKLLIKMIRKVVYNYYSNNKFVWKRLLVEKEPLEPIAFPTQNYKEFLENIQIIFPGIKILFILRDPVATIWSMTKRGWGYSVRNRETKYFSLDECIQIWKDCASIINELKQNNNFYLCNFNKLILNPKKESFKITRFLGINCRTVFIPKPTKKLKFSKKETEQIKNQTQIYRELYE